MATNPNLGTPIPAPSNNSNIINKTQQLLSKAKAFFKNFGIKKWVVPNAISRSLPQTPQTQLIQRVVTIAPQQPRRIVTVEESLAFTMQAFENSVAHLPQDEKEALRAAFIETISEGGDTIESGPLPESADSQEMADMAQAIQNSIETAATEEAIRASIDDAHSLIQAHQVIEWNAEAMFETNGLKMIETNYHGDCFLEALLPQLSNEQMSTFQTADNLRSSLTTIAQRADLATPGTYMPNDFCSVVAMAFDRPVVLMTKNGFLQAWDDQGVECDFPQVDTVGDQIEEGDEKDINRMTEALGLNDPVYFYYEENHYIGAKPQ